MESELAKFVQGSTTGQFPSRQPDCPQLTPVCRPRERKQGQFLFVAERGATFAG